MTRDPRWPRLLDDYIAEARSRPFEWGRHDCGLFAANWVRIATGRDPAKRWRRRYTTERGAWRVLRNDGLLDMEDVARAAWGEPIENNRLAGRGDVVSVLSGGLVCLGIHIGHRVACVAPGGLVFLPIGEVRHAWRI